jgi:hypothetical protein
MVRRSPLPSRRSLPTVADAAPVLSTVSANAAQSGGGTVTISGLSFGTDGRTPTATLDVSEPCGSTSWTSTTTVACTPQAYGGTAVLRIAISLSAVVGTVLGQFSFDGTCTCAQVQSAKRKSAAGGALAHVVACIAALWLWQRRA